MDRQRPVYKSESQPTPEAALAQRVASIFPLADALVKHWSVPQGEQAVMASWKTWQPPRRFAIVQSTADWGETLIEVGEREGEPTVYTLNIWDENAPNHITPQVIDELEPAIQRFGIVVLGKLIAEHGTVTEPPVNGCYVRLECHWNDWNFTFGDRMPPVQPGEPRSTSKGSQPTVFARAVNSKGHFIIGAAEDNVWRVTHDIPQQIQEDPNQLLAWFLHVAASATAGHITFLRMPGGRVMPVTLPSGGELNAGYGAEVVSAEAVANVLDSVEGMLNDSSLQPYTDRYSNSRRARFIVEMPDAHGDIVPHLVGVIAGSNGVLLESININTAGADAEQYHITVDFARSSGIRDGADVPQDTGYDALDACDARLLDILEAIEKGVIYPCGAGTTCLFTNDRLRHDSSGVQ